MSKQVPYTDPDDYFSHTRMGFGDHIEDLRRHLLRAVAGFLIGMIACLFVGMPILSFIAAPVEHELGEYYQLRKERLKAELEKDPEFLAKTQPVEGTFPIKAKALLNALEELGFKPENNDAGKLAGDKYFDLPVLVKPAEDVPLMELVIQKLGPRATLKTLRVEEGFMVWFKVCIVAGLVVSSPWVFYQIWAFIAAGLYPHEKRIVHYYLPFAIGLFLGGIIFAQFIVIPQAVHYLLMFTDWLGFEPDLRLTEWLGFALLVPLVFGVAFQTPLVMLMLERVGIASIESYQKVRRYAIFALTIVAALLAPGDIVSMIIMVGCLVVFYEFGIILCKLAPKQEWSDLDVPDSDEMIEV